MHRFWTSVPFGSPFSHHASFTTLREADRRHSHERQRCCTSAPATFPCKGLCLPAATPQPMYSRLASCPLPTPPDRRSHSQTTPDIPFAERHAAESRTASRRTATFEGHQLSAPLPAAACPETSLRMRTDSGRPTGRRGRE